MKSLCNDLFRSVLVGEKVMIGANAVVTKDVPANTVVVGYNRFVKKSGTH